MSDREIVPLHTAHMPEFVDPLEPRDPDNAFTETRRLRHDGWTPEKKRLFLERFAECGVIVEACEAAGMSGRAVLFRLCSQDADFVFETPDPLPQSKFSPRFCASMKQKLRNL